ncbi:MAG TPA: polysaccharide deacetylase family protein, partial [Oligoflexia bacterium]|nr:polysaccharide deacetylase family protein [Oligoflexia bacterium]
SRGSPVDRYYMQHFLERHKKAVKGRVLEAGDPAYTHQFGSRVVKSDVLNVIGSPGTTVVGNLQSGTGIPLAHYDCVILTQTVQFVFGIEKAVRNAYRALKPGGTLLLTASGISQISRYDMDRWGEYWRLTDLCLKEILSRAAPDAQTEISTYGNVASAKAFLDGISAEELPREVLDYQDPDYQLLIAAVVHKPKTVKKKALPHVQPVLNEPVILLYHRVANDPVDSQLLAVTPEHFSQQLSCLSEHLRVLALEELLDEVRRGFYCPDTAALTFDDGYADNLLNARALLEHHRLPATFFVASGMTGSTREFWWDAFEHLLLLPDVIKERAEINLNGRTLEFKLDNAAARFAAYDQLCGLCRALPPSEAASAARQLYAAAGLPEDGRLSHRALSREQLKQLAASPVSEIGSHTIDHAFLAALPAVEQRRQLVDSKAELERITGQTVRFLSYPWGTPDTFSAETMRIAQETGYEAGIANIQDALRAPVDFFAVPRFLVRNWNGEQFLQWLRTPAPDRGRFEQQMLNSRERRLSHGLY